jgi:hypothetical protein
MKHRFELEVGGGSVRADQVLLSVTYDGKEFTFLKGSKWFRSGIEFELISASNCIFELDISRNIPTMIIAESELGYISLPWQEFIGLFEQPIKN